MKSRFNNRLLLIIFISLAAVFAITRLTTRKRSPQSLRTDLVSIDTSRVTTILLYPRSEGGRELEFIRSGEGWTVTTAGNTATADPQAIRNTLAELNDLKAQQLVSRSEESWANYQVADTLGTRVIIREGKEATLDLVVGRFHYEPPPQGSYNMYGQNRMSGKTYVRLQDETEVYSVEGFLAMSLNQGFDRWRDKRITQLNRNQLSRIIFDYPSDSGFVAQKEENRWMAGGLMADSAAMAGYLNRVIRKSHSEFADGFQPAGEPEFRVTFEGDQIQTQQVSAYRQDSTSYVLRSSLNPETWFEVTREGVFQDLFPGVSELTGKDS